MGLGLGLGLGGCLGTVPYPCSDDEQCVLDGVQGFCEEAGYCSLPDDGCDGGRRFTEHAPEALANGCIGEEAGGSESGDSGPGATTGLACEGDDCGCAEHIVVSGAVSCAITTGGGLSCWGSNTWESGWLVAPAVSSDPRDSSNDSIVATPVAVDAGVPVKQIALGDDHACVVGTQGGVRCWGVNTTGKVSGSPNSGLLSVTAPDVQGLEGAIAVGVGERSSCALLAGGANMVCWGGVEGVDVQSLESPGLQLAMTRHAVCVRSADGVRCAGDRPEAGMMGGAPPPWELEGLDPTPTAGALSLVAIPGDVVELAASREHYCAGAGIGQASVWCWGIDELGEVGRSNADAERTPIGVTLVPQAAGAMGLGAKTSCAVDSSMIHCWGEELGLGSASSPVPSEQIAMGIQGSIDEVGVGNDHACVLTDRDLVWCWSDGDGAEVQGHDAPAGSARVVDLGCP